MGRIQDDTEVSDLEGGRDGARRRFTMCQRSALGTRAMSSVLTLLSLRKLNDIQVLPRPVGMRW